MAGVRDWWITLVRRTRGTDTPEGEARTPPTQQPAPSEDEGDITDDLSKRLLASPVRFPEWTGSVVLAWFPVSLLVLAVISAVSDETTSLAALTLLILGFFLVVSTWLLAGKSAGSVLGVAAGAVVLTALCLGLLVGVASLGNGLSDPSMNDNESPRWGERSRTLDQDRVDELDLVKADLRGFDLSGLDFSGRDIEDAVLDGAQAVRSQFVRTWLPGSSFRGSDLVGADFTGACLAHTDLRGANLAGATFLGADVTEARVAIDDVAQAVSWPTAKQSADSTACELASRPRE